MQTGKDSLWLSDSFAVQSLQITQAALFPAWRCLPGLCSLHSLWHKEDLLHPSLVPAEDGIHGVERECHGVMALTELFINSTFQKHRVYLKFRGFLSECRSQSLSLLAWCPMGCTHHRRDRTCSSKSCHSELTLLWLSTKPVRILQVSQFCTLQQIWLKMANAFRSY